MEPQEPLPEGHDLDDSATCSLHSPGAGTHTDDFLDPHLMFGQPEHDRLYWHEQSTPVTCGTAGEISIYEAITGEAVSETYAAIESAQHGFLTTEGTRPDDVGRWLEMHGIECHGEHDASFLDILAELAGGNKVIVGVDSSQLWGGGDALSAFTDQAADHAIWLTGVDIDSLGHVHVVINDSGRPDGAGNVYDLQDLEHAIGHRGFHYVATGHGPSRLPDEPVGYDAEHHRFPDLDQFVLKHAAPPVMVLAGLASAAAAAAGVLSRGHAAAARSGGARDPEAEELPERPRLPPKVEPEALPAPPLTGSVSAYVARAAGVLRRTNSHGD